jgi:hypothetical protein
VNAQTVSPAAAQLAALLLAVVMTILALAVSLWPRSGDVGIEFLKGKEKSR